MTTTETPTPDKSSIQDDIIRIMRARAKACELMLVAFGDEWRVFKPLDGLPIFYGSLGTVATWVDGYYSGWNARDDR